MNNKISNKKVELPQGINLNDRDYLNIMLYMEKTMLKNYTVALTEASNEFLHDNYLNMFDEIDDLQRKIFNTLFKKGWYTLEKAEEQKVLEKLETLEQELNELN